MPNSRRTLELSAREDESLDAVCGVQILQRRSGYRFNLDPVLLAHFSAEAGLSGPAVDLGTGSGIIPLILARKFRRTRLVALELQPRLFELAERNVQLNRCERRVAVVKGDLRLASELFLKQSFAHVLCNPPYHETHTGHLSQESENAIARHEVMGSLADFIGAASYLLRHRGSLDLVYPATRLGALLAALELQALVPRLLRMVHPREGSSAKLVMLRAMKVEHGELDVLAPLVLHPEHAKYTCEVERMLR